MLLTIVNIPELGAYVASSSNFRMEYDSLNNEGGLGNSSNFRLEDTMGEDAIGISNSANFKLKAGFQHLSEVNLSISSPTDVAMNPSIGGITGGTSTGTISWTVTTDNPGGYSMNVSTLTSPAMTSATSSVADYTPVDINTPDFNWSTASNASEFGYSPESTDLVSKFKDNGFNTCGSGSSQTADKCWYNFKTTNELICQSALRNDPGGSVTNFKLKAEVGSSRFQQKGSYAAQITATAVAN